VVFDISRTAVPSTAIVKQSNKNGCLTLENEGNKITQNFGNAQPMKKRYNFADLS
jgi:hypothetical protein